MAMVGVNIALKAGVLSIVFFRSAAMLALFYFLAMILESVPRTVSIVKFKNTRQRSQ
ncbi:MAG: hypothetical protein LBV23_00825 [Deltaproteobacteria bacterium]|nr:hypothetical protein [Deltaproteobacteria bacterium]